MEARDLDEVAIPHKLRNAFSEINFIHGKVNKESHKHFAKRTYVDNVVSSLEIAATQLEISLEGAVNEMGQSLSEVRDDQATDSWRAGKSLLKKVRNFFKVPFKNG